MKSKIIIILISFILMSNACCSNPPEFSGRISKGSVDFNILDEASGIEAGTVNNGIIWVHNDSDKEAAVYALNENAAILGKVVLKGIKVRDWEDISSVEIDGINYLAIGDIGDNDRKFATKKIYIFPEPKIVNSPFEIIIDRADTIEFTLSDGVYDSESFMIDPATKDIFIISKRLTKEKVYKIKYPYKTSGIVKAEFVVQLNFGTEGPESFGVTGADISPDGKEILVRTYTSVYYFSRESSESIDEALKKEEYRIPAYEYDMGKEPQGEGICWKSDASGFYTLGEFSPFKIAPNLWFYEKKSTSIKKKKNLKRVK